MRRRWKFISVALLSGLALGSATLTAYWLSILARGAWKYPELLLPICVVGLVAFLILGVIASICIQGRDKLAVLRFAAVLTAVCVMAASGVFFGVLDNCRLSCGTRIKVESKSPTGHWKAIWFTEKCASVARYCPTISHVSVVREAEHSVGAVGNAFSIDTDLGVELEWKSDDLLLIRYWPLARVLRRTDGVGAVRIEYLPFAVL